MEMDDADRCVLAYLNEHFADPRPDAVNLGPLCRDTELDTEAVQLALDRLDQQGLIKVLRGIEEDPLPTNVTGITHRGRQASQAL